MHLTFLSVCLFGLVTVGWTGKFSQADKNQILDAHNHERANIARGVFKAKGKVMPQAKNMYQLKWDNKLEAAAQAHANKCVWKHSKADNYGENLAMFMGSEITKIDGRGRDSVNLWWSEFQKVGWKSLNLTAAAFKSGIGHATQEFRGDMYHADSEMLLIWKIQNNAWSKTRMIGCGAQICDGKKKVIVVCQYKSPGNYNNQFIYNKGKKCSSCHAGTKCVTKGPNAGLCN